MQKLRWVPQAEVANLVEALGQNVLEEATHELLTGDADGPPAVRFAMLVASGDGLVVEADDVLLVMATQKTYRAK